MTPSDFDRKRLERGLVLLFHYTRGLEASKKHPVAAINRERIGHDADDLQYLSEFTEANIKELFT